MHNFNFVSLASELQTPYLIDLFQHVPVEALLGATPRVWLYVQVRTEKMLVRVGRTGGQATHKQGPNKQDSNQTTYHKKEAEMRWQYNIRTSQGEHTCWFPYPLSMSTADIRLIQETHPSKYDIYHIIRIRKVKKISQYQVCTSLCCEHVICNILISS
jgi:hypothetical protein